MDDVRLLHISDPHFGAHDENKVNAFLQFVEEWRPDLVVITGDIVNHPFSRNFVRAAKAFLDELRGKCSAIFCVPGNHDQLAGKFSPNFWTDLQSFGKQYVRLVNINGQHVCLVGIDTTRDYLLHLNNSGAFSEKKESFLQDGIDRAKKNSSVDWSKTIVICLVHHHPIPTVTSQSEGMLYFKNSGRFLRFAARNSVRLVLHGHQHDPHFTKISFGSDSDEDMMGVLSAGSCFKNEKHEGCGHFYSITVNQARSHATSYSYDLEAKGFFPLGEYSIERNSNAEPRLISIKQILTASRNGAMKVRECRRYERTSDKESFPIVVIGVDEESDGASKEDIGLVAKIDEHECSIEWIADGSRDKKFKVVAPPGLYGEAFELIIEYTWVGGFKRLITAKKDSGGFRLRGRKVEWCSVELNVKETGFFLEPIDVYCERRNLSERSAEVDTKQHFTLSHPKGIITWHARLRSAPPR